MPAPLKLSALPEGLQALSDWRAALAAELGSLARLLAEAGLLAHTAGAALQAMTRSLADNRLAVAVVGEAGRGKSELANALFFADTGQRLLPVGPGGSTVCPIELEWRAQLPPMLDLLPIATRRQATRLAEWRSRRDQWQRVPLRLEPTPGAAPGTAPQPAAEPAAAGPAEQPQAVAPGDALTEVAKTRLLSRRHAASLGLLPAGPPAETGQVEVPVWRHALANLPQPLLQQGLVVIDTPGLGSVMIEPELTMGLLPSADLLLFVLSAASGVTESERELWAQHAQAFGARCLVVLGQCDACDVPAKAGPPHEALAALRATAATMLGLPVERVLAVSARDALTACWQGDAAGLRASGVVALEAAVTDELLAQRRRALASEVMSGVLSLLEDAKRRLRDQRRGHAEQMLGLRGLRSESGDRFTQLKTRLQGDTAQLQRCASQLDALRAVQAQAQRRVLLLLDGSHVQAAAAELQATLSGGLLRAGSRAAAFAALCQNLRGQIDQAAQRSAEVAETWRASFEQINAEFGSFLVMVPAPELRHFCGELDLIEQGYSRYFSLGHAVRMATPEAAEPLRRMLVAKLRLVFEGAREALVGWHQTLAETIGEQLSERRLQLRRREDSLRRIERAADELELHLHELEQQDSQLLEQMDRAQRAAAALRSLAERGPQARTPADVEGGSQGEGASPANPPNPGTTELPP